LGPEVLCKGDFIIKWDSRLKMTCISLDKECSELNKPHPGAKSVSRIAKKAMDLRLSVTVWSYFETHIETKGADNSYEDKVLGGA